MSMLIKRKNKLFIVFVFIQLLIGAQSEIQVYKIDQLLQRIHNPSDTVYVVNFWATWCKPCVAELPDFEKLSQTYSSKKVKVLLVSLNFKDELESKVTPFIKKRHYTSEVLLLDEVDGNTFINKIDTLWTGAIPATLIVSSKYNAFYEKKLSYEFLEKVITSID